jgi:putative membrane protein
MEQLFLQRNRIFYKRNDNDYYSTSILSWVTIPLYEASVSQPLIRRIMTLSWNKPDRLHLAVLALGFLGLSACWSGPATAHGDEIEALTGNVWTMWDFSPTIIVGCLLVLAVYFRGYLRRRQREQTAGFWKALSFISGVALTYTVLQSPVDALSDHVFWIHRIQHVALHHWIPMLLVLSAPIAELIRGLPAWARRGLLKPVIRNRGVRAVYGFIQHPVVAPLLFVGLIYFWLTPPIFQYATLHESVHEIMHYSMLIEGIPFWWLMLDPKPGRISYTWRLLILWAIMMPQILLGAYITMTHRVLYPLYATLDQGWVSSYLADQQMGGLIIWIPASMMSVVAALIVIRFMVRRDAAPSRTQPAHPEWKPAAEAPHTA